MSSIGSAMSGMSISAFGEDDMELEVALDKLFKDLQTHLNETHCQTRSLAMLSQQDADYKTALDHEAIIDENVDGMIELFKELKRILPQVIGKPQDAEEKAILATHKAALKARKDQAKAAEIAAKAASKLAKSEMKTIEE